MNSSHATLTPVPLGLRRSFGFGDRLGLATPGHLTAACKFDFAPIFAQQSIRELARTNRQPAEVMQAAQGALKSAEFSGVWGADADHLKTPEDVARMAGAGFTFFTIDPSAGVNNRADAMSQSEVEGEVAAQQAAGLWSDEGESALLTYQGGSWEAENLEINFSKEQGMRAIAKYGRAVALAADLARAIERECAGRPFEIEVSVDETDAPTSPLEHAFFALELKRRGVKNLVSLAPRFVGEMEKGIDYRGDLEEFERELKQHVAIAKACGPYKISVHSGSDKFSIYPIVGRVCGELLHVKTAGTSYLEALRVVVRTDARLFAQIAGYCHQRFAQDRLSYHISTTPVEVESLARETELIRSDAVWERLYLDERVGRQLLHVTFGSVLTQGHTEAGRPFKDAIFENLEAHATLHSEVLEQHFVHHLRLLQAG